MGALQREVGTFLNNRAKEVDAAQKALDQENAKPLEERNLELVAQLSETIRDNAIWAPGGSARMVVTALTAAAGGNVTGTGAEFLQSAAVNYLQSLGAQQVKQIADNLDEVARTALHGLLACGGAAAQGQSCGAGAASAAATVVLNNLIQSIDGKKAEDMTAEEKEARINLVNSLVAGITAAAGGDAVVTTTASKIEMENNYLGTGLKLFGLQIGKNQVEEFSKEMQNACQGSDSASCVDVYDKWKALSYAQGGLQTEGQREHWEEYVANLYERDVIPLCKDNDACKANVYANMMMDIVIHAGSYDMMDVVIGAAQRATNIDNGNWFRLGAQATEDLLMLTPLVGMVKLPGGSVTVYRVEGLPNTRILIGDKGQVIVQGDQMLFLNFGDKVRAEQFFATRLQQGMPGAQMKSFEVPKSFLEELRSTAVPESMAKQFPGKPLIVDPTKAPNQFGLRPEQIEGLPQVIIPGSGRVH